ncbi:hypothetical protein EU538_07920 [Candidatus Thorarchaeota archaeon]|jgi:hypothetical protein|nr:MAG: hypothetical protein EU538_07920 [Candidatus Thorarchaeota archaeon]
MISGEIEERIRSTIEEFPNPYCNDILATWDAWIATNPEAPYYLSWSEFASQEEDESSLFSEERIYIKKVSNELRDLEVPKTFWQKVAKALAAVASMFLVIFLALSRVSRAAE